MKLKIEISMDNAAFFDNPYEYGRILYDMAAKEIDQYHEGDGILRDLNGNTVGYWEVKE